MNFSFKEIDLNDYEPGNKIIGGAFDEVFEATNKKTGEKVAIKKYLSCDTKSLSQIMNSLEAYDHNIPGTLKIFGYQQIEKEGIEGKEVEFNIFMELLKHNFSDINYQYLKSDRKSHNDIINPTVRSKIIFGVASILEKMHEQNIIFRDVKPHKIGLDDNLEPKLFHNLLAKVLKDPAEMSMCIGTPLFMAPELNSDEYKTYSFSVDVYSYGIMVYIMFEKDITIDKKKPRSAQQFMRWISHCKRFDKSPKIPEHYWELICECWKQNPDERPTFSEIVEILKNDKFAIEEFGMKTNLNELHEYQNSIDN